MFDIRVASRERTYVGELSQWCDSVLWVSDALHVDRLRVLVDSRRKFLRCLAVDELDSDVELLQEHFECILSGRAGYITRS